MKIPNKLYIQHLVFLNVDLIWLTPFPLTAHAKYDPVLFVSMKKIQFCTGKMVVLNQKVLFSDADRKVNLVKVTKQN